MAIFNTQFNSFGLDISDDCIKVAKIKKTFKGICLEAWGVAKLEANVIVNSEIKDPEKLSNSIKQLLNQMRGRLNSRYVVSTLPENKTFIKILKIKNTNINSKKADNLKQIIIDELPNHIPIATEELRFDWQIVSQNDSHTKILVGAVPEKIATSYSQVISLAGLKLIALEIEAQAVARAVFKQKQPSKFIACSKKQTMPKTYEQRPHILIDFGANRSSIIFYHEGLVHFTSGSEISGNKITQQISEKFKMKFAKAEKAKIICGLDTKKGKGEVGALLRKNMNDLITEVSKAINYYQKINSIKLEHINLMVTGGGSGLPGLKEFISQKIKMPVLIADPLTNISVNPENLPAKQIPGLTTAIGLGLRHIFIEDL